MSSSKLSVWCDKLIEVGWLFTLVAAPLFFSGYWGGNADADKLAVFRSLATMMAAMWLIKWIEERQATGAPLSQRSPLALPTLAVVSVQLIATLTSVAPGQSFLGADSRPQGTYALLSYVVVFALIVQGVHTRQQFDRLVLTLVLTSLPVAVYGILQRLQLDSIIWKADMSQRVGSTIGNPIFLGAYLLMVFFVTLAKVIESVQSLSTSPARRAAYVRTAAYGVAAAVQAWAIVLTESRGPWLGWFAGIVFFVVLLALARRQTRIVWIGAGVGVAGLVFLIVLNLPITPLESLRQTRTFNKMGRLFTYADGRNIIWDGAANLMSPNALVQWPDGTPDPFRRFRWLTGYGPDSLQLVYTQFRPAALAAIMATGSGGRDSTTDHSHNETWDVVAFSGVLGLLAYQWLYLGLCVCGLRGLGLLVHPRERNWMIALWLTGGLAGGLTAILVGQAGYLGLGIPAGNLLGLTLYLLLCLVRTGKEEPAHSEYTVLLAALLAGVLAHYVEIQVGIDLIATRSLFWGMAGLMVVIGYRRLEMSAAPVPAEPRTTQTLHQTRRTSFWSNELAGPACVLALILTTLLYAFTGYNQDASTPWLIFARALTYSYALQATSLAILGLIVFTWSMAVILVLSERACSGASAKSEWRVALLWLVALPLAWVIVFEMGLSVQVAAFVRVTEPDKHINDVLHFAQQLVQVVNYYWAGLGLLLALATVLLTRSEPLPRVWVAKRASLLAGVPLLAAAGLSIHFYNQRPIQANVFVSLGDTYRIASAYTPATTLQEQAARLVFYQDVYSRKLAKSLLEKASGVDPQLPSTLTENISPEEVVSLSPQRNAELSRLDSLYAAQAMLLHARNLNPLLIDNTLNLARFYLPELPVNTPARTALAERANRYYGQAVRLSPNRTTLWNEWGRFDLEYRNDPDAAIQKLQHSLALEPVYEQTLLQLGQTYITKRDLDKAAGVYQQALALKAPPPEAHSKLAFIYYQQGQLAQAAQAFADYIQAAPDAINLWEAHKNLALIYKQMGDIPAALREAQAASEQAPAEARAGLTQMVEQLRAQAAAP